MKTLVCILTVAASCLACQAQLLINGKGIVYDALANQWLCTVSAADFGTDFQAQITLQEDSQWSDITLDGHPVSAEGTPIVIPQLDGTTPHTLTATVGDSAITGTLLFSYLPILEIRFNKISTSYHPATFTLHHPDSVHPQQLMGRIKWRGRSTLMDNRHKRNFHIKLENETGEKQNVKLLGLRNDNSWLLDAGQIDLSRIRNFVGQQLWLDMAEKPYYADREPNARSATRGQMIEVVINSQYEGIYCLSEAMDRKQMKLAKYEVDETGDTIIHGQLWKAVDYTVGTTFHTAQDYDNTAESWLGYATKYPDLEEVCPTDYSILHDAVQFTSKGYDSLWRLKAKDYFDLPVIRDYYILEQVLLAIDNTAKNIYWAVYDGKEDKKLTLAVWDLDCTVGQDWTNNPFRPENRVGPERDFKVNNNLMGRLVLLIEGFKEELIDRYQQLREGVLNTDSITLRYTSLIDRLIDAGAAQRESVRWNGDSDIGGHDLDWDAEKAYICDWFARRLRHLDITTFAPAAIADVNTDEENDDTPIYDLMGRQRRPDNLPHGIYVKKGKKFVIK